MTESRERLFCVCVPRLSTWEKSHSFLILSPGLLAAADDADLSCRFLFLLAVRAEETNENNGQVYYILHYIYKCTYK
jgi:hypothetical protein